MKFCFSRAFCPQFALSRVLLPLYEPYQRVVHFDDAIFQQRLLGLSSSWLPIIKWCIYDGCGFRLFQYSNLDLHINVLTGRVTWA